MFLYRIINIKAQIDFAVSTGAVVNTILIFGVLYFLTLIYNLMQVKLANPIELLRGGNVGEKEPKSKWLIAIIGLGCLAGGYYIAITTKSPLQVLSLFFVAVPDTIQGDFMKHSKKGPEVHDYTFPIFKTGFYVRFCCAH